MKALIIVILLCCSLSFPAFLSKASATNGTTLYIDPPTTQGISVGGTFTVNVTVSNVPDLYSWQAKVLFNATVLACTNVAYPSTGFIFSGRSYFPLDPIIDNTTGYVLHGSTLLGAGTASGSGVLTQITFKVLAIGTSDLSLSKTIATADTLLQDSTGAILSPTVQDGFFTNLPTPPPERHDVAITALTLSAPSVKQGENVSINTVVLNNGTGVESFNVTIFYDSNPIHTFEIHSMSAGNTEPLSYLWNTTGVPLGPHTIKAEATVVSGETAVTNNVMTTQITVLSVKGVNTDLNHDGKVNILDLGEAGRAFGSFAGHARWDANADINGDGVVNLLDIFLIAKDFGKIIA